LFHNAFKRLNFIKAAGKLPDEFYSGFSGKPDSSKSSLFILRDAPTAAVKKHKLKFSKK